MLSKLVPCVACALGACLSDEPPPEPDPPMPEPSPLDPTGTWDMTLVWHPDGACTQAETERFQLVLSVSQGEYEIASPTYPTAKLMFGFGDNTPTHVELQGELGETTADGLTFVYSIDATLHDEGSITGMGAHTMTSSSFSCRQTFEITGALR